MKKWICLLMALVLMVGTTACGSKATETTDTPKNDATASDNSTTTVTQGMVDSTTVAQTVGKTLRVPSKDIYFTCPEGWSSGKETHTTVLLETDECLVAVCYNWSTPYNGDLVGIIDFFGTDVMSDVASYSKGNLWTSKVNATSTENTTVAGLNAVKFTGTAPNNDWNCHVYGYTMMVNDLPMMVMGLVSTKAQDPAMISEVDALTDQVAASIRTTR